MVELITAGGPDVVCLQEIPAWALTRLGAWSGMQAVTARAKRAEARARCRVPRSLGRALAAPRHGRPAASLRGQGNAILFPREATVRSRQDDHAEHERLLRGARREARADPKQMVWWEQRAARLPPRPVRAARTAAGSSSRTSTPPARRDDLRLADAELRRAINFIERGCRARRGADRRRRLQHHPRAVDGDSGADGAAARDERWSDSGPQIDHVLLRSAIATSVRVWPDDERESRAGCSPITRRSRSSSRS